MSRRLRLSLLAAATTLLLAAAFATPHLLRRAAFFEVKRVEIAGNRFLPPHELLAASGIRQGQNVWDDPRAWEALLLAHPGVEAASVSRRLPGTLRVRVREMRPVAYVQDGALLPATAAGEIFPLDPSHAALDLPIVRAAWPDTAAAGRTRALLREVGRLGEIAPGLLAEVSEIRAVDGLVPALALSHRLGEIVLPLGLPADRLGELQAVLADLERRAAGAATPEPGRAPGPRTTTVDVRFEAQIVVRSPSSV
jgi:cell division protein FtsQ